MRSFRMMSDTEAYVLMMLQVLANVLYMCLCQFYVNSVVHKSLQRISMIYNTRKILKSREMWVGAFMR